MSIDETLSKQMRSDDEIEASTELEVQPLISFTTDQSDSVTSNLPFDENASCSSHQTETEEPEKAVLILEKADIESPSQVKQQNSSGSVMVKRRETKSWSVLKTEREKRGMQAMLPQKQRAQKIVEMVIYQNERVPPYAVPVPGEVETPSEDYSLLPKEKLLGLLKMKDTQISKLRGEKEAAEQTLEAHDNEWTKCIREKLTQERQFEEMRRQLKIVTESHNKLHHNLLEAWKKGFEAGKQEVSKLLEQIFSEAQVKALLTKKRINWTPEDIASAIALHACSKKAFEFIKNKMKIPLPSESTLRRWAAKIKVIPGLQEDVLKVLGNLSSTLSQEERLVCLSFDEIQLSQRAQLDTTRDAVVGPHKHAQVVMMRPLSGDWKQPIYFGFDEDVTPDLFLNIVERLYQIGFIVVATVCDLGPSNQKFLSNMNVYSKEDASSIDHPCDKELKIYFFADAPHMLKLFRNHLITAGINYKGCFIGPEILRTTINLVQSAGSEELRELRSFDKLNLGLLDLGPKARMRVRPAAQLLSNSTSTAISYFFNKGVLKNQNAPIAAKLVQTVNDWFDIFNSREGSKVTSIKGPFGKELFNQESIIKEMTLIVEEMRVKGHKSLIPFQRGIIMSNRSLVALYRHLKSTYGIQQLHTSKLNQDCLESYFSWIRAAGLTYTTPTALDFIYRMKKFLLSKSTNHFSKHSNCLQESAQNFCAEILLTLNSQKNSNLMEPPRDSQDPYVSNEPDENTDDASATLQEQESAEDDQDRLDGDPPQCLSASMLHEFLQDDLPDLDLPGELEIPADTYDDVHHLSAEMRENVNSLVTKNGYFSMASYLASKFPALNFQDQTANEIVSCDNTILNEDERAVLGHKTWLVPLVAKMEELFKKFHGLNVCDFDKEEQVTTRLAQLIVDTVNCDFNLAKYFAKTRLLMRLRDFNLPIRNASLNCSNKSYAKYYA